LVDGRKTVQLANQNSKSGFFIFTLGASCSLQSSSLLILVPFCQHLSLLFACINPYYWLTTVLHGIINHPSMNTYCYCSALLAEAAAVRLLPIAGIFAPRRSCSTGSDSRIDARLPLVHPLRELDRHQLYLPAFWLLEWCSCCWDRHHYQPRINKEPGNTDIDHSILK
jgi:hypothetical protein